MSITEKDFEWKMIERLIQIGYPKESIITEWRNNRFVFDIMIVDLQTNMPLMLIECKINYDSSIIDRVFERFKIISTKMDQQIRFAVAVIGNNEGIDFYDFTAKVYENAPNVEGVSPSEIPSYQLLNVGYQSKLIEDQKTKKRKYINGLKIACWIIIPLILLSVIMLDYLKIYSFTTERLFIYGFLLLSILIPFFGEIKIGEISLLQKKNDTKEEREK